MKTLSDNELRGLNRNALIKTIKEYNKLASHLYQEQDLRIKLQDKIEKTIEYIKELEDETDDTIYDISRDVKLALVDFLQGNKEEE